MRKCMDVHDWLLVGILFLMVMLNGPDAIAAQAALFSPESQGIPLWQFILILISPGMLAITLTIVWMRYQRVFAADEHSQMSKRQWFYKTLKVGAVFGPLSQAGLQGLVHYLTGLPVMWELIGLSVLITGIFSAGAYEAVRWRLAVLIKGGKKDWMPVYNWISAKPGETDPETGDDIGHLTQFMQDDKTEPKK